MRRKLYPNFFKRVFDLIAALCALVIFLPVFMILLPFVYVSNRGHVFFTQLRPGHHGRLFRLIKLKTMNDKCDMSGKLLPDKNRLTAVGRFVRSLSLDEIPQVINVLKGDMSIVGPRPLLAEYLPLYNSRQARRHEVRPGITGWAQVKGRNSLHWEQKLEYDVWYTDNVSFWLDIRIIFVSIYKVLRRESINSEGTATMRPFTGINNSKHNTDE